MKRGSAHKPLDMKIAPEPNKDTKVS
ncbi:methyl-accepting chemotaxis protein III, partial [Yersinia pestis PY-05]